MQNLSSPSHKVSRLGTKTTRMDAGENFPVHRRFKLLTDFVIKDKDKVAEYKAGIKEQLTRAGLIRGQPRTAYQLPSKSIVPSQSGLYTGMPASNGTPPRRASYSDVDLYRAAYASNSQIHASGVIPVLPGSK